MGAKEPPREESYVPRDEEIRADVLEVSGSVKWFDPGKGYGFILPDEDLPDILLHVSCLRRDGFQTAYEGSRIICDVVRTAKGLQAAQNPRHGQFDGNSSSAAAAAHPCCRHARE